MTCTAGASRIAAAFSTAGGAPGAADAIEIRLLARAADAEHPPRS
jgi:hypothetical protein